MSVRKLDKIRKQRSLVLAIESDGAKTTINLHQEMFGFKVAGVDTVDLSTSRIVKHQTKNAFWPTGNTLGYERQSARTNQVMPI